MKNVTKRSLSLLLCLAVLLGTMAIGVGATDTEDAELAGNETVLELEYMDFYENQEYYMGLVEEKDYTLHFVADGEYEELELARQAENVSENGTLMPIAARGTAVPTKEHIITKGTYSFSGKATYSNLYTNVYCTGSPWYIVTINNHYMSALMLTVTAYNVIKSQQKPIAYATGTTIKKYTMDGIGPTPIKGHFYLKFAAPLDVSGTIADGAN